MDEEKKEYEQNVADENKQNENKVTDKVKKVFDDKTVKICIVTFIATLLGSFFAMYFVTDKYLSNKFQRPFRPDFPRQESFGKKFPSSEIFEDMEKFERETKRELFADENLRPAVRPDMRMMKNFMTPFSTPPVKIKTEKDNDTYNIIVSLKPFENDENKIKYEAKGNVLRVHGKSENISDNSSISVSFSQDFVLSDDYDLNDIKRYKDGDKLIISVPVKN